MRILQISTTDISGGAARAAHRLATGLRLLGHDCSMLVGSKKSAEPWVHALGDPETPGAWRLEEQAAWMDKFYVHAHRTPLSNTHFSLPLPAYDLSARQEVLRAEVIHLHWVAGLLCPAAVARLCNSGKPVIWTLHDQRPFTGGCHYSAGCRKFETACQNCPQLDCDPLGLTQAVLRDSCQPSASLPILVSPSRWLAQCARQSAVFRHSRIVVIPNGLDTRVFAPGREAARRQLQWDPQAVYLLSGADGFEETRKGFDLLCAAARHCLKDAAFQTAVSRKRIIFVFYGNAAKPPRLDFPAQWLGRFDDDSALAQVYAASDAFILPSREDNFPNTMLEATACGTPVIGFNVGGLPEVIGSGENGLLAHSEDPRDLALAILAFSSSPDLRRKFSENCANHIPERYSLQRQAEQCLRLYEEEISRHPAAPARDPVSPLPPAALPGPAFGAIFRPMLHRARLEARARGGAPPNLPRRATVPREIMDEARSIAVLIPSRNCAALIPGHLQSLEKWMDLAEEIVVVDSHSHDGTLELLRAGLSHPRVKFLAHPPGLYQSWNFGIQNVSAKYVYVATVGDPITRRGIQHLYDVAETFQSDVVISKPGFINESGEPLPDDRWPIDVILDRLKIRQPQLLATAEQFVFAVTNTWGAILGSSASNLYRTDFLQPRPFPTEYGTAGDGGWGIEHIFEVKIAVTPERFSNFRQHEKAYSLSDYHVESLASKLFLLAQAVVARQRRVNPAIESILNKVCWTELERSLDTARLAQSKLEAYRHARLPWFLNPDAWKARSARNRSEATVSRIMDRVLIPEGGNSIRSQEGP
jgi:glycosyltransferase involved in cell wall biosynthesis